MPDPPLSDIDFKNKMAWVWTTLKIALKDDPAETEADAGRRRTTNGSKFLQSKIRPVIHGSDNSEQVWTFVWNVLL